MSSNSSELKELVDKSIFIIREVKAQFKNPAVLWSTGKDSTTTLNLIREAFYNTVPWPVIHLDTGKKFKEIYQFRDKLAKQWDLNLIVASHPDVEEITPDNRKKLDCCTQLKTEVLKRIITQHKFDAIVVSIRRDEHGIRNMERYFSPRDKNFHWQIVKPQKIVTGDSGFEALQDTEMSGWNLYTADFGDIDHVRVHPILHWSEIDVWKYIDARHLPYNPLYRADYVEEHYGLKNKRFRSLGCIPCTIPVPYTSTASTIKQIIYEIAMLKKSAERDGRAQDKESQFIMQKLRTMGYM